MSARTSPSTPDRPAPSPDAKVHVLPPQVANQIAAGEVVERPASVVKELVENAIDAGARQIAVNLLAGGAKLIAVRDDGSGMTREDAITALEPHATSKITGIADIESIATLGFRGEAIPSIASVSRFAITTRRRQDDEGTRLDVDAGRLMTAQAAGGPPGTLVEVKDLFCNVPARRNFLRRTVTEESHVRDIFTCQALAHPEIGFTLTADGREINRLAPTADLTDRVRDLFGEDLLAELLPLDGASANVTVRGFIERPHRALPSRHGQYVFVNGRSATAPAIAYALKEAYPRRDGETKPAAIVFITLPSREVDVNVHPTKREVRFRNQAAVKAAIMNAVAAALGGNPSEDPLPPVASVPNARLQPTAPAVTLPPESVANATVSPAAADDKPAAEVRPSVTRPVVNTLREAPGAAAGVAAELPLAAVGERARPWTYFHFLALTESGYLLIETDAGLVTVNPLAARERIAFEQLVRHSGEAAVQQLLLPETVHLPSADFARLKVALADIRALGFELEEFGRDTFKVDAVPQLIGEIPPALVLSTIACDLAEGGVRRGGEKWREELIAKSVARSFAGSPLKLDATLATRLVEELSACRMPYLCPRGKPVMIFTSTRELDRKFAKC